MSGPTPILVTLVLSASLAALAGPVASAQVPADSLEVDRGGPALPDTSAGERAVADSLVASAVAADTLSASSGADSAVLVLKALPAVGEPRKAAIAGEWIDWTEPQTLEELIEWIPGATVRVAGDRGMPAYVGIDPISLTAPEIWMDGIPTRSPADLDPGVWDRSAIAVQRAGRFDRGSLGAPGDPGLWMDSTDPEPGRTVLHGRFGSTAEETFHRAVSVMTPGSGRALRVDFEEWKTEEGIAYSGAPGVSGRTSAGRSKMRRFRVGADLETEAGRLRMFFGRGRRFYRGSVLSADAHERWTGELSLSLDRQGEEGSWRARAWHLDWHDEDRITRQEVDGSRLGTVVERRPSGRGWTAGLTAERWSARYVLDDTTVVRPGAALVARARGGYTGDPQSATTPWFSVELAHGGHLDRTTAWGARFGLDLGPDDRMLTLLAERRLRVPNLAETDGRLRFDAVQPLENGFSYAGRTWTRVGESSLEVERQEHLGLQGRVLWRVWQLEAGLDHWRLRDGVGWRPEEDADSAIARVVGATELDVTTLTGRARLLWTPSVWRLRGVLQGQRVVGDLEERAGRGGGWPEWNARVRVGLDRRFFSDNNRLGVDVDVRGLGPRQDDVVSPLSDLVLPTRWRIDGRLRLSIREAILSVGYDNLLDTEIDEVLGTIRRGRQLHWRLDWTIYN